MADFNKGDRIVKMSGVNAGKYGTINSISESGTLNVTFDGERLPRFCDPERCGKIGLNAKFKVGDRVWFKAPVTGVKVTAKITATLGGEKYGFVDDDGIQGTIEGNAIYPLNSRAANAKFKVGDRVKSAKYPELGEMKVVRVFQDIHGTAYRTSRDGFLTDDIHYDRTLIPANSRACNDRVKGHFVWFAPWNGRAGEAADEIVAKVPGAKREGANIVRVKDADSAATVYALFRKAKVPTRDLNIGFNSSRACNAAFKVGDRVRHGNVMYISKTNEDRLVGTITRWDDDRGMWEVKFKGDPKPVYWSSKEMVKYNSRACNAEITPELRRAYDEWQKAKAKFDKWWNPDRRLSERPPKSADATKKGLEFAAVFKKVTGKLTPNGYGSMSLEQMVDAVSKNACRNASIDDEFPKLKAMGKANAEKYLKDHAQELIDKYGHPELVKLAKKIQSIRLKPIKKGRFAGKSGDMTYYVDYTADSMHASRYGKDGTNVTEIQVTGPYVMDPDGKERRHILYYYRSGTESIPAQSSEVRSLVSSIMRGPDVVKQGDAAFAWNACGEDK